MSDLGVLLAARDRVAQGWIQHTWARDKDGRTVGMNWGHRPTFKAVCWCVTGAIWESPKCDVKSLFEKLDRALPDGWVSSRKLKFPEDRLIEWNDTPGRTQAEAVALFDRAIEREREA